MKQAQKSSLLPQNCNLTYVLKMGRNHFHFFAPKTCLKLFIFPKLNPFLSGPCSKMGARNDSVKKKLINN